MLCYVMLKYWAYKVLPVFITCDQSCIQQVKYVAGCQKYRNLAVSKIAPTVAEFTNTLSNYQINIERLMHVECICHRFVVTCFNQLIIVIVQKLYRQDDENIQMNTLRMNIQVNKR